MDEATAPGAASLLSQIQRLESELHHPGRPCSHERLEQLLHPEFHEVGRSGLPYDRATVIAYLASVSLPPAVEASDHRLEVLSDDCVLLTYRSARRSVAGAWVDVALRSSIWRRSEQAWRLFYHQGTPASV